MVLTDRSRVAAPAPGRRPPGGTYRQPVAGPRPHTGPTRPEVESIERTPRETMGRIAVLVVALGITVALILVAGAVELATYASHVKR